MKASKGRLARIRKKRIRTVAKQALVRYKAGKQQRHFWLFHDILHVDDPVMNRMWHNSGNDTRRHELEAYLK